MTKKWTILLTTSLMFFSHAAFADVDHKLIAKAEKNPVKVQQIKKLKDETAVKLTGTLFKHLNQDHYEFKDNTGIILLDIDEDVLEASKVQVGDKVNVWGEVDVHSYKPTDIEVEKLEKIVANPK